ISHSTQGSVFYMAPELFEGKPLTHASDVYAMGCVYYFALSGKLPCDGKTTVEVMASHMRNDLTALTEIRPDLPEWLCQWVHWLMARSPEERPQTPEAVIKSYADLNSRFCSVPQKFMGVTEALATIKKPTSQATWYTARGNQIGGPHTLETIQLYIESGALRDTDLIKTHGMESWQQIRNMSMTQMLNAG
ncbi:MAG: protein kinase domain-containing protein, partial [Akkermansiaceae bacterium]